VVLATFSDTDVASKRDRIVQRQLNRLTWPEVAAIPKQRAVLVLPVGAVEQHGPHLSTDCDLYFADRFADLALERLSDADPVYRLPSLAISKSNEHAGFPGTFWLSAQTLSAVIMDIARGAQRSGFQRLVIFNCHGGNRSLLESLSRDVRAETGLLTFSLFPPALVPDPVEVPQAEADYGIHAGDWETSVMLALDPSRVRMDQLACHYPAQPGGEQLAMEFTGATYAWLTRDLSPSGLFGDATLASAERGQQRLSALIPRIADALCAICDFAFDT
jgi:creatinine amidohydrolase